VSVAYRAGACWADESLAKMGETAAAAKKTARQSGNQAKKEMAATLSGGCGHQHGGNGRWRLNMAAAIRQNGGAAAWRLGQRGVAKIRRISGARIKYGSQRNGGSWRNGVMAS